MVFRIEYYRAGALIGSLPCPKPRDQARVVARTGIKRFDADSASILDDKGQEVELVKRDA